MSRLSDKQQARVIKALLGKQIIFFNFTNSDVIGLKLDNDTTIFVPTDDVLVAIGALE